MWRRICKKYFQSGGQDGGFGITEIGLQIFDYRWLLGSWSHHCWGIDSRSGSLSWWHEKCGGLCACQGWENFGLKVWRIFFDFLSIPFVMFLMYSFWLAKGWQRENWSWRYKEQSYGHWTFEFFTKKKAENHDGQKNHECLGHFLLCVGLS